MATWDDLKTDVFTWTNRPNLVTETELALRQAIRTAHRQGKFWRDITTVSIVPPTMDTIQQIDLETYCPNFKQISYIKSGARDFYYSEATAQMLLDHDGYAKVDVYWGIGNILNIRACAAENLYEIAYYRQPITAPPESIDDWLLATYKDVVVLIAAGTILGIVGEQEIKSRVDTLLLLEVAGLQQDQIEITGR
jgi:hypothetical protein